MGTLNVVGIGPGHSEHMTPAVLEAIKDADHVIGYTTYIRLIKAHFPNAHLSTIEQNAVDQHLRNNGRYRDQDSSALCFFVGR